MTIYDKDGTRITGFLLPSDEVDKTFPGIIAQLQHLAWSPLMGEPDDPDRPRRVRRQPIKVGGNVQESKLIRRVEPVYPELAKQAHVQGRVVLVVTVDEEGNVSEIKVTRGHSLLYEAAVMAVRQWKYSPTLLNGEPVPVIAMVTVTFSFAASGEPVITVGD
jgi:TonB family protein